MRTIFRKVKALVAKPRTCKRCGSTSLVQKLATYPVPLTGALAGRRVDVYRVEHDKCRECGFADPTPEGHAKIKRCTKVGIEVIRKSMTQK